MSEWISVKDKLPDFDICVLIYSQPEIIIARYVDFTHIDMKPAWEEIGYGFHDPTHWMPLPEPPK